MVERKDSCVLTRANIIPANRQVRKMLLIALDHCGKCVKYIALPKHILVNLIRSRQDLAAMLDLLLRYVNFDSILFCQLLRWNYD